MTPGSKTSRRVVFGLYLVATGSYLAWRATTTLNPAAPIWSAVFFVLELYACVCSAAFYLTILDRTQRSAPPAPPGLSVDVFICTYNESPALLRQTLRRALAMTYPHKTFVCDDGRRPEVRALAEQLGCGYLTRPSNEHFKAGNLNNALAATDGELCVVLDADHLVRPTFLDALLGYFEDPKVALVQTPQVFYNVDSFQHHFQPRSRRLWHEGAIFHHAMQPGADRWNAAFFVGVAAHTGWCFREVDRSSWLPGSSLAGACRERRGSGAMSLQC